MVIFVQSGDDHIRRSIEGSSRKIEVLLTQPIHFGKALMAGRWIINCDGEIHQLSEVRQYLGDSSVSGDQQLGLRHYWFDIDIHHAPAGHAHAQDFILHIEGDQNWLLSPDTTKGLPPDST